MYVQCYLQERCYQLKHITLRKVNFENKCLIHLVYPKKTISIHCSIEVYLNLVTDIEIIVDRLLICLLEHKYVVVLVWQ